MKIKENHNQLREVLIREINTISNLKQLSKTALAKMSDENLVHSLFERSVLSEKEFWKKDIIEKIMKMNPKAKNLQNETGLINRLIKEAQLIVENK